MGEVPGDFSSPRLRRWSSTGAAMPRAATEAPAPKASCSPALEQNARRLLAARVVQGFPRRVRDAAAVEQLARLMRGER